MREAKEIKTKLDGNFHREIPNFQMSGWLDGKRTYLWFGDDSRCFSTLSDKRLYSLAKRIVAEFEKEE